MRRNRDAIIMFAPELFCPFQDLEHNPSELFKKVVVVRACRLVRAMYEEIVAGHCESIPDVIESRLEGSAAAGAEPGSEWIKEPNSMHPNIIAAASSLDSDQSEIISCEESGAKPDPVLQNQTEQGDFATPN